MIDWDRVRVHLQPALDAGGNSHSFEDVQAEINRGDMQLWTAERGSIVTCITDYPQKRVIQQYLAGGEMEQVLDFQDSIREWAKAMGCVEMTLAGRAGWVRALKSHGWTQKGIIMEATL